MTNSTISFQFEPGAMVADRYQVIERLGKGGMGAVFRVHDHKTRRDVALKAMLPKFGNTSQAAARFEREVRLCRRLNHPGIVKIYDAQKWNDILFYTMDYIQGKTLRHWLAQQGRLDFGSGVRVLCLVADALEHAHEITIHRDLSPENVMVLADGSVRLLDFGLAKLDDKFQGLTMAGANMGKLMYIAPEQEHDAASVDHRADIYSLGVMFFEVMVGRTPLPGEKPGFFRDDLPPEADAFFSKATAYRPEDRFYSAREFRNSLLGLYKLHEARNNVSITSANRPPILNTGITGRLGAFFRKILFHA